VCDNELGAILERHLAPTIAICRCLPLCPHELSLVCVCLSSGFMWGSVCKICNINYKSFPPNDVPSIPWDPVVLSFWTPGGLARGVSDGVRVSWMYDSVAAADGQFHHLGACPFKSSSQISRRVVFSCRHGIALTIMAE